MASPAAQGPIISQQHSPQLQPQQQRHPPAQYQTFRPPPQQEHERDDQNTYEFDEEPEEVGEDDQHADQGSRAVYTGTTSPFFPSVHNLPYADPSLANAPYISPLGGDIPPISFTYQQRNTPLVSSPTLARFTTPPESDRSHKIRLPPINVGFPPDLMNGPSYPQLPSNQLAILPPVSQGRAPATPPLPSGYTHSLPPLPPPRPLPHTAPQPYPHTLAELRTSYADLDITNSISDMSADYHGLGGYADIYKALWTHEVNPESTELITVAVKRLRVNVGSGIDAKVMRRLRQEISVWRRLEHVNVQKLHGLWWGSPQFFPGMVSTWQENGDINNYLRNLPSATAEHELFAIKLYLLKDVLRGLVYLHSKAVIHADIKGANILVGRDGKALLTDFGIAWTLVKNSQSFTTDRGAKGSNRWMAPEFFPDSDDDGGLYTTGSDVWAYGCLFLEVRITFSR